jgi:hypothetical protein
MLNDDDLGLRLRTFMEREIGRSRPIAIEVVQTRGSRRGRLNRFAIAAVAASLLVIVGATLAAVGHRPGEVSAPSDARLGIVILPGSGNQWVAFAVRNNMTTNVGYGLGGGAVDRRSGSSWEQVDYFEGSLIGGTRPGTLSHNPPAAVPAVELGAAPGALGPIHWIDVSSLAPGTYRLRQTVDLFGESSPSTGGGHMRHASATGEFRITHSGAAQAPPLKSEARIDPGLPVLNGSPTPLALALVGGTGDLASDTRIEKSLSLTVHVRRWQRGEWVEVTTRQAVRLHDITTTISLPRLTPGLYELARAKPSGGEIEGWLFVTNVTSPSRQWLDCRVSLGNQRARVEVKIAPNASRSAVIAGYTTRFTILRVPTNGIGFMRADVTGPTLGNATHAEGGFSTQNNAFSGRIATPKGQLGYVCGA